MRTLEYTVTMGKFQGKMGRRRSRKKRIDSLVSWHVETSVSEMIGPT